MKLLSREEFKKEVFKRDNQKCIKCLSPAVDAHHLIERKLFSDHGYYLDNGVSLCEKCHLLAEATILSVEHLRELAKIKTKILPSKFSDLFVYDKWGNKIEGEKLIPGPLFHDPGCIKMLNLKKSRKQT